MNSPSNRGAQKLGRTNNILVLEKRNFERSSTLAVLGEEKESMNMEAEYTIQVSHGDTFWGIDKERRHMLEDLEKMMHEDQLSNTLEKYYKAQEVRHRWDLENQLLQKDKAVLEAMEESDRRNEYMKSFFLNTSSAPIMEKTWHLETKQANIDLLISKGGKRTANSTEDMSLRIPKFGATKTLFHQDGLQQARTLAPEASELEASGTNKLMSASLVGASIESMYTNGFELGRDQLLEAQRMTKLAEEVMHGHSIYQWDQEALLREAFAILDSRHTGELTPESISHIARNESVKSVLRYTVLGVFIKLRVKGAVDRYGWRQLLKFLFNIDESSGPEATSATLTLPQLIEITRQLSYEKGKPLQLIKTHEEYLAELSSTKDNKVFFAEKMRANRAIAERDLALHDQLHVGDTVWTLYKDGSQWQPAIIETVNDDYTYDVRYPMSQDELRSARKTSASNKILRKGNVQLERSRNDPVKLLKMSLLRSTHSGAPRVVEKALEAAGEDKELLRVVSNILMLNRM